MIIDQATLEYIKHRVKEEHNHLKNDFNNTLGIMTREEINYVHGDWS